MKELENESGMKETKGVSEGEREKERLSLRTRIIIMIETNDLACMGVFCANMIFIIICMIPTTYKKKKKVTETVRREKRRWKRL